MKEAHDVTESHAGTGRWLRTLRRRPGARLRLVCFPHAGGAASWFAPWTEAVPADVELCAVRYPGREDRLADSFVDSMEQLAEELSRACAPLADQPMVFFGHSMGASVAYEVAARLAALNQPPALLCVSAREGPGSALRTRALERLDDERLIAEIRALGGTQGQAIDHPELRSLVLPAVRADYRLIGRYVPHVLPLPCPVVSYYGTQDADVPEGAARSWQSVAPAGFTLRAFPGGHFYLAEHMRELVIDILRRYAALS